MASSKVEASNFALSHCGVSKRINSMTERGKEAEACNLFFDTTLDEMLRDFAWPFARKVRALALVSTKGETNHPDTNYTYAYRYPSDCLFIRRIQSGIRTDYRAARVTYDEMADDQGTLIVTDKALAILEFTTTDARNPSRWSADFVMALSFRLASYIAVLVTGGDPFKVGQNALGMWIRSNKKAQATAANEVQPDVDPEGEGILARS